MEENLRSRSWRISYRTSSAMPDGRPTDILHDFYLPALRLSTTYDRVAGYFRSSSLAAASQGFTAFLRHDGHMRLIVGSDMASEDVDAILRGDEARLSHQLLKELAQSEDWEKNVQDGVNLLARMVASGQLEVRVAFRVNTNTGNPLAFDATEDGYVHEKWFIMGDEEGNHLYGSGSLNESKTALTVNAENIDIHWDWEGGSAQQRVQSAQSDFRALWENDVPHMRVLSLPEAVRERLVSFAKRDAAPTEIDGTISRDALKPSLMEVLRFAVLRDAPRMPGGRYVGMYSAPVLPWPHQETVSRRLIETWPYSYMLCDEVGLGKTIEAALAIRSLVLSGYADRVLITAPASLTKQWHRELAQKAMLPFARTVASPQIRHEYIYPEAHESADHDLYSPKLNIISTGLLARKERADALSQSSKVDIALVDEAHYARRQNPRAGAEKEPQYGKLYVSIHNALRPQAKSLWMATATPMQIDPIEVYDLLRLTSRVAAYEHDPSATMEYFCIMGKVVSGEKVEPHEWSFLGTSYHQIEGTDPYLWRLLQKTCVDARNRKILETLQCPDKSPKRMDQKYLPRPMFAASPLSRVMMRHTRQLLEIYRSNGELTSNLAKRHVLPIEAVRFTEEERSFYNKLEDYCAELSRQIQMANEQSKQMMFFLLSFLQLRFASSLYAIEQTLIRRLARVRRTLRLGARTFESNEELQEFIEQMEDDYGADEEDIADTKIDMLLKNRSRQDLLWEQDRLQSMIEQLSVMSDLPSKIQALLITLEKRRLRGTERIQQTVLFTRFLDSLRSIRKYLSIRNPRMRIGLYSGQFAQYFDPVRGKDRTVTHEEIKRLFIAGEIDLLLCTDAAAEGLNLQTADMLINFDLGWNPMKIEQRIGRIDRIGQKYEDIFVLNMCYLGSAEETVYGRLLERLQSANLIVGLQQISLLPVEPNEFRDLEDGTLTEDELMRLATERLKDQRRANASMEMSAAEQYDMYHKMSTSMRTEALPARLEDIWETVTQSEYLNAMGAAKHGDVWSLPASELFPRINATINREQVSSDTDFFSWGNPKFDALTNLIVDQIPEVCSTIRQVSASLDEHLDIVGYVVKTHDGSKLITSFSDLNQIDLDTDGELSDEEIARWTDVLRTRIDRERQTAALATNVERVNRDIARLHFRFVREVAIALLEQALSDGEDRFWKAIPTIVDTSSGHLTLSASGFIGRQSELMFIVSIVGDKMHVPVNAVLRNIAVELAVREASTLKVRKADVQTEDIIRRLRSRERG